LDLSVWAKLNNVTNDTSGTIYSQKRSTEDCRNLLIHWEGDLDQTMTLQVRDSACHELMLHNLPTNPMVAGQWYHLVGVGTNKTFSSTSMGAPAISTCRQHGSSLMRLAHRRDDVR
jgi:hypothetical protein